jgi:hypothetical protein
MSTSLLGTDSEQRALRPPEWVAEFLGVSVEWVVDAAEREAIPCVHLGSCVRFDPVAIKAWVRKSAPEDDGHAEMTGSTMHALLGETRAVRQLLEAPRSPVRPESVPLVDAAKLLGCSKRRVEQLLKAGVLRAGPRFGKRAMVTVESIESALRPAARDRCALPRGSRRAPGQGWLRVDRSALR